VLEADWGRLGLVLKEVTALATQSEWVLKQVKRMTAKESTLFVRLKLEATYPQKSRMVFGE